MHNVWLIFNELEYMPQDEEILIGSEELDSYIKIPAESLIYLQMLADGNSINDIKNKLQELRASKQNPKDLVLKQVLQNDSKQTISSLATRLHHSENSLLIP